MDKNSGFSSEVFNNDCHDRPSCLNFAFSKKHGFLCQDQNTEISICNATCDAGLAWPGPDLLLDDRILDPHTTTSRGLYCAAHCTAFPTPLGTHMDPATCRVANTDECPATCDLHATCTDLDPLALHTDPNATHRCSCDDGVFPVDALGHTCATSGLELDFAVDAAHSTATWPRSTAAHDILTCLYTGNFTHTLAPTASVTLHLDYSIHVRLAMHLANLAADWKHAGHFLDTCLPVNLTRVAICTAPALASHPGCDPTCPACDPAWPAVWVTVVDNALDNPIVDVASFGYVLSALSFAGLRWRIALTFDANVFGNDNAQALPFVFLSRAAHVAAGVADLPCALGERNLDGTCCLDALAQRLLLPRGLENTIGNITLQHNGSCPSTALDGNFLKGSFGKFSTSEVRPLHDNTVTLTLAYDDVVQLAALTSYADDAEHVQFFVGLGVLRTQHGVLQASAAPLHLYSKVTPHYYFTSQVRTDDLFTPAMFVQLVRVLDRPEARYFDFAQLTLYLPDTQGFDTAAGDLLPLDSVRVGIGYTPETSSVHEFYPCILPRDAEAYATVQARDQCSLQLAACALTISSDRVVNIVFPLGVGFLDRMMEEYDQWDVLPLRLFVDFVLRVRDAEGRATFTRFYTSTQVCCLV